MSRIMLMKLFHHIVQIPQVWWKKKEEDTRVLLKLLHSRAKNIFYFQTRWVVSHLTEKIRLFLKLCPMFYLWAIKPNLHKRNSKWTMTNKSCWLRCQNFHPVLQWFYLIYNLCNVNNWFLVILANKPICWS